MERERSKGKEKIGHEKEIGQRWIKMEREGKSKTGMEGEGLGTKQQKKRKKIKRKFSFHIER